jgi:hypothetical protein
MDYPAFLSVHYRSLLKSFKGDKYLLQKSTAASWPKGEARESQTRVSLGERRQLLNQLEIAAVHRFLLA